MATRTVIAELLSDRGRQLADRSITRPLEVHNVRARGTSVAQAGAPSETRCRMLSDAVGGRRQSVCWRGCAGAYKGLCALSVKGADKHVALLPGGLDGRYRVHHCEGGRPAYVREKSPPARAIPWHPDAALAILQRNRLCSQHQHARR